MHIVSVHIVSVRIESSSSFRCTLQDSKIRSNLDQIDIMQETEILAYRPILPARNGFFKAVDNELLLQLLMTKIFKTKSHLNPPFIKDIFQERNMKYNLRHGNDAKVPKVRTTSFGIETIAYLGSRLWQLLPHEIKQ